jgi:hypothetical protein
MKEAHMPILVLKLKDAVQDNFKVDFIETL